jgi:hypothetical protein
MLDIADQPIRDTGVSAASVLTVIGIGVIGSRR